MTTVCGLPVATLLAFSGKTCLHLRKIFLSYILLLTQKSSVLTCFLSVSSVQHEINKGHKTKAVFQESFKMRPSSGAGPLYAYIGKLGSHLGRPYSKGNKKKITFLIKRIYFWRFMWNYYSYIHK